MFNLLWKQKYPVVLAALGVLLVLISFFNIEDLSKFKMSRSPSPIYAIFILGILLILLSIVSFLFSEDVAGGDWLHPTRIKKTDKGYRVRLGQATLNIIY